MNLTEATVRNRHAVWALALAAAIFGALAYVQLPMQLFPDTSPPLVNVVTVWPGAAAEDISENLSRPMEEEFASLEGAVEVSSSSQDNLSIVSVEFDYDRDVDIAAVDTQNAIARIRDALPTDIKEPQVLKFSTSDRPVIALGVRGDRMADVRRMAEDDLAPRLQRLDGVAAVDVFGGARNAVLVEIDQRKLEAWHVPFGRVVEAIQTQNVAAPAGTVRTQWRQMSYRVETRADDVRELEDVTLTNTDGSRLRLGDVARVHRGSLDDDSWFGVDGERAIAVQVFKTEDANTVDLVERVEGELGGLRQEYPDLEFVVGEESGSFTEQSISNLLANVWQALLLASVVIFLFIGRVRASLVAVVSMPLSYGMTFALMKVTGTEFNMVTLSAIILAVGMVVDASVVVLENVSRKMDEGMAPHRAAVEGTDEVRLAVLAGAASTVVVLVPLLFLEGFVGKTFGPLATTLLFAFGSSVVVALVLVPVLTIYTGGESKLDRIGARIVEPFGWLMDRLRAGYVLLLRGALHYRVVTVIVAVGMFVGGGLLLKGRGMEVLPKMDGGSFFVSLQTPSGSSIDSTSKVVNAVEELLMEEEEVVKIQSQVGWEPGMKTASTSGAQGPTQGFVTVTLTPRTERDESIWEIEERVRAGVERIPGIRTFTVRELGNTAKSTTAAPIVVQISGDDPLVLDRLGDEVVKRLSNVPDVIEPVRDWRIDQERVNVDVDELRSGAVGLDSRAVARQMTMGSEGARVGVHYEADGGTTPIRVRYGRPKTPGPEWMLDFSIPSPDGVSVPLRSVASVEYSTGRALVTRDNFQETLNVTAFAGDRPLSFVIDDVEASLESLNLPQGYSVTLSGENSDLGEARGELGGALIISLIAVYLLLLAQLRSFLHPLIIMGSVPLSLLGVGAALAIAGKSISMPVMVGLILLIGIVVNNAIILIDFIREEREGGASRRDAIIGSVETRFRPIMMTSFSTIFGMTPLAAEWALGAERFSPLAVAVIGGMITATFLTLVVIPVLYDVMDDLSVWGRSIWPSTSASVVSGFVGLLVVGLVVAIPASSSAQEAVKLTLEESVRRAHEQSHAIDAGAAGIEQAEARRKAARSGFLPRLELDARYSRLSHVEPGELDVPVTNPGQEPPDVQFGEAIENVWYFRASLSQPLFTGFSLLNQYDAAEAAVETSREEKRQISSDVRFEVVKAYFELHAARELAQVARESVALLEAHESRLRSLKDAGRATGASMARAEARLARSRAALARARGAAELAESRLGMMLGLDARTEIVLVDGVDSDGKELDEESLKERALQNRTELKVARAGRRARAEEARARRGQLYPHLFLQAGYTLANPHERYVPPQSEFNDSWDVSLVLRWTVWDWGGNYYQAEAADAGVVATDARIAELERQTALEVERHLVDFRVSNREVEAARVSVQAAERAMKTTTSLFEAGRIPSTEVLEVELDLTRAKADLARAQVERRIARARVRRLIGALP